MKKILINFLVFFTSFETSGNCIAIKDDSDDFKLHFSLS